MTRKISLITIVFWSFLNTILILSVSSVVSAAATKPAGSVSRAQFTTLIINKEPIDQVVLLGNDVEQVYFFTDLRQLSGKTIRHRWEYKGDLIADIPIKVGGPRWRTDSRMILDSSMLGKWTVLVIDEAGWVLKASNFEYVPAELARTNSR